MKKFILLALLVISVSLSAQNPVFTFYANKIVATDGINSTEENINLKISLNFDKERCVIYSRVTQIIDFTADRSYIDENGYKVIECSATDSNYKKIRFNIYYNAKAGITFFQLIYSDLVYLYICTLDEE